MLPARSDCRICGSTALAKFLELGPTPLANRFLKREELGQPESQWPLDLYFCPGCSLVQLCDVVPADVLFRDYVYVTGTSDTMSRHFAEQAGMVASRFLRRPGALVVEVASNDGTLLRNFKEMDVRALGVEPATNIAEIARSRGVDTLNEFFSERVARSIVADRGPASAIIANNVFAHVDALNDFASGVRALLAEDGVFVFENSYVFDTIDHLEFDSVYHEHHCYYSVTALAKLFERNDLEIFDVVPQPVHGGSLRVFVQRKGGPFPTTDAPARIARTEEERGVRDLRTYQAFAERVYNLRHELVTLLHQLRARGARVAAYGASAKGNTLLNFTRIGPDLVSYVVDKSPLKQGLYTPGMHLPVLPPSQLLSDRPDYALLLAWNFVDEVMTQQRAYIEAGGRFIVPIPTPRVL